MSNLDRKKILGLDIGTNSIGWALINRVNEEDDWFWEEFVDDDGKFVHHEVELDPNKNHIIDSGSRIFTVGIDNLGQGEKESSKNEQRRTARGIRRQYFRRRLRKNKLLKWLAVHELRPESGTPEWQAWINENPYLLRRKALSEALSAYEFGRVLYNLAQQRGFKSNRKTDKKSDDAGTLDKGAKDGSMLGFSDAEAKMQELNLPTIGAYFAYLVNEFQAKLGQDKAQTAEEFKEAVRIRARYTKRQWFIDEFDKIWATQKELQPAGSTLKALFENEDARAEVRDRIIYFQRPLRSMKEMIGKCQFEVEEKRATAAHPDVQLSRLMQELNSMEIYPANNQIDGKRRLTAEERKILIEYAAKHDELILDNRKSDGNPKKSGKKSKATAENDALETVAEESKPKTATEKATDAFNAYKQSVFYKALGLKTEIWYCNLSSKKKLKGLKTIVELSKALGEGEIKEGKEIYAALTDEQKERLFKLVLNEDDPDVLKAHLTSEFGFNDNQAEALTKVNLEEGYSSLSLKATRNILPFLLEGQLYNEAQAVAGYHHALPDDAERVLLDALPAFYWPGKDNDSGEGKVEVIRNPIVQKAMYELRRLVNAIIRKYGRPDMICIELARDLKGNSEERKKWSNLRDTNFDKNENGRAEILEIFHKHGVKKENPSRRDLEKYHLWQQQNERCIYSGRSISVEQLFKDGVIEVDHIFPYSRSQNDKPFNKVVCYKD
jgi:CRISPR-associated endonuclease Csn1